MYFEMHTTEYSEQFFRSVELGTRKMGILLLEPLKSSGSNPKK